MADSGLSSKLTEKFKELKGTITPNSFVYSIDRKDFTSIDEGSNLIEVPETSRSLISNIDNGIVIFICVYATYFTIKADKSTARLLGTDVYINKTLDRLKLTRFDLRYRRLITLWRFYSYDNRLHEFRLPRYALPDVIQTLTNSNVQYRVIVENYASSSTVDIKIADNWHPRDYQEPVIKWLTNSMLGPLRATELQTGMGKTSISIMSAARLMKPFIVMASGILDQWERNIFEITTVSSSDVYVIKGHPSLKKLFKDDHKYKIYIASLETIRSWISNEDGIYTDVPSYSQFISYSGIGTKIIDEFHLNFGAISSIDLRSNVENNFYLSATPARSDKSANRIFNIIFPRSIIHGSTVHDKYVNCTMYGYRLEMPNNRRLVSKSFGYSHIKYEQYLIADEGLRLDYFRNVIKPIVTMHYINKFDSGKLLIFVQTILMVQRLVDFLSYYYPDKKISTYVSGDSDDNLESDIIISTPKSAGVGTDIKNLVCCIFTVSMSSEPLVKQVFGRLRKLPDGRNPEFVDIYNTTVPDHVRHKRTRESIYKNLSLNYQDYQL